MEPLLYFPGRRIMLLAIDIGNTSIAVGVFSRNVLGHFWKIKSDRKNTCDEYKVKLNSLFFMSGIKKDDIKDVIISSVVPPLTPVFQKLTREFFGVRPLIVGPGLKTGIAVLYDNPQEVGADRIVSAVGAREKYGAPCIVLDFGTATTFDAVSASGDYLGGAIAPGIHISAEALYLKTAKLPRVELKKIHKAIGKNTNASMHSGLYFGYIGLVKNIIREMKRELGGAAKVIATGGAAFLIFNDIEEIDFFEPHLVLDGLRRIFEKNRKG